MKLMPLANLLEAAALGVKGDTLFVGMMPAAAEEGILLRNPLAGTKINHELPGFFQTEFQVIVRTPATQYDDGEALIERVIAALTMENVQVEDHAFNYSRPRTEPVAFPLSKGNLLEFNVMFDCCFVRG
jgi:hypothetical protein